MQKISIYEALNMLPEHELRTVAVESVHKFLCTAHAADTLRGTVVFDQQSYSAACCHMLTALHNVQTRCTLNRAIASGWEEYCTFWAGLCKTKELSSSEIKLQNTFTNYMDFAFHVHTCITKAGLNNARIVELGAGYGFASYALTCLGYEVLALSARERSSWHSWLMDRFMMSTMPIPYKDNYSYSMGTLNEVVTKFGTPNVYCLSGVPIIPSLSNLADAFAYLCNIILDFLGQMSVGGLLILSNMKLFAAEITPVVRKLALVELAKLVNSIDGVECLEFNRAAPRQDHFPSAWTGYDLGLVLRRVN